MDMFNYKDSNFLKKFNEQIDEAITNYYRFHDADNFFAIDEYLRVCTKQGLTINEVPRLIEMKNIIVMG